LQLPKKLPKTQSWQGRRKCNTSNSRSSQTPPEASHGASTDTCQVREIDTLCFERFLNLHCRRRKPSRKWQDSISIGANNSDLRFCIYRKAQEMVAHRVLDENDLADYGDILRIEPRFKGKKLLEHLRSDRNIEMIDGKQRLVRFGALDLYKAIVSALGIIEGVFHNAAPAGAAEGKKHLPLGRLLARVASDARCEANLPQLVSTLRFYAGRSSGNPITEIRKEGLAEIARRSPIRLEDLTSEDAYKRQASIAVSKLEATVRHHDSEIYDHPSIYAAYTQPDQPLELITQCPLYLY
jgi:hypothetical protein